MDNKAKMISGMDVFMAAKADAQEKGLGREHGGRSTCACPCGGTIHYSVAAVNGHMHLICEDCDTRMME